MIAPLQSWSTTTATLKPSIGAGDDLHRLEPVVRLAGSSPSPAGHQCCSVYDQTELKLKRLVASVTQAAIHLTDSVHDDRNPQGSLPCSCIRPTDTQQQSPARLDTPHQLIE